MKKISKSLKVSILLFGTMLLMYMYFYFSVQRYEASIQNFLNKGKVNELKGEDLIDEFGKPRIDEILEKKIYNLGNDQDFNCSGPFRFLGFRGKSHPILGSHFEDNLYFYFDKDGKYCYFERISL